MDNKWSIDETKQLFDLAFKAYESGKGLSAAFGEMSRHSGKSVNSIRNYYYSQLRLFEMLPEFTDKLGIRTVAMRREKFNVFSPEEIDALDTVSGATVTSNALKEAVKAAMGL